VSAPSKKLLSIPHSVTIYRQEISALPDAAAVCEFLKNLAPWLEVTVKDSPVFPMKDKSKKDSLCELFARARIVDPESFTLNEKPFPAEIQFEMRLLDQSSSAWSSALYSGHYLAEIFRSVLPKKDWADFSKVNIVFTDRVVATREGNRAHIRYALFGVPTIISTAGIVYGPARSRNYYLVRNAVSAGTNPALARAHAKKASGEDFLEVGDPRLTSIACNICSQALFYHLVGDPFCGRKSCILFNAHTQADILRRRKGLCGACRLVVADAEKEASAL